MSKVSVAVLLSLAFPGVAFAQAQQPTIVMENGQAAVPPPPPQGYSQQPQPQVGFAPQPVYVQQQPVLVSPGYMGMGRRVAVVPYEGGPIPPGAMLRTARPRWAIGTGAGLLGGFWLASVFVAGVCGSGGCAPGLQFLYIPAVGPFLAMTDTRVTWGRETLVVDGIVQTVGLGLLIYGIVAVRQELVIYGSASPATNRPQWALLPSAPGTAVGASFVLAGF